jgi:heterodisulfide reductase subunit A
LIDSVLKHQNIQVHLGAELTEVKGFVGNFKATIKENGESRELNVGTIIVAVGAQSHKPTGTFGYGRFDNVMTQLDFEAWARLVYRLQACGHHHCVGQEREEATADGSAIVALKNAILAKANLRVK